MPSEQVLTLHKSLNKKPLTLEQKVDNRCITMCMSLREELFTVCPQFIGIPFTDLSIVLDKDSQKFVEGVSLIARQSAIDKEILSVDFKKHPPTSLFSYACWLTYFNVYLDTFAPVLPPSDG
jgi:hypothetical protein